MWTRRDLLATAASFAAVGFSARSAAAQSYPNRPITIVVPYPPGGTVGLMARIIADRVGPEIGATFVVENKGGGAGAIGTGSVARSAPDGYSLVLGTQQTHATNPSLIANLTYDPVKDFVPVAQICALQHLLTIRKDLDAQDMRSFVAMARAKPDGLNYGSTGVGSAGHFIGELFRKQAAIPKLVHVPFRGAAPLAQELLGGRIDFAMASVSSVMAHIEAGNLRALGTASATRSPNFPQLPTFSEMGIDGVAADAWFTLFAPSGTPQSAIDKLYDGISKVFARDDVKQSIIAQGVLPLVRSGKEIAQELPTEIARWAAVAREADMKPE